MVGHCQVVVPIVHHKDAIWYVGTNPLENVISICILFFRLHALESKGRSDQAYIIRCYLVRGDQYCDLDFVKGIQGFGQSESDLVLLGVLSIESHLSLSL